MDYSCNYLAFFSVLRQIPYTKIPYTQIPYAQKPIAKSQQYLLQSTVGWILANYFGTGDG